MHVRGRLTFGRSQTLAFLVTGLALLVGGPSTVLAGGATAPSRPERVVARVQQPGDATGFRLPFEPGIEVPIHQGWNGRYSHNGESAYAYDFGLYDGTPVLAAASGVVSYTHSGETACGGAALRMHANFITIDHPDGSATQYGHLSTVDVEVGDVVAAGDPIGRSGKTGYTGCMPHLHFARQVQGGPVTQSLPVYFDGYPDRALVMGQIIEATAPACSATDAEAPLDAFCGTYSATSGEGPAYFSRLDAAINFSWAATSPGGYWLDEPVDGFSAHWAGRFTFASAGRYTIGVVASDGVRISIDGVRVLNVWKDRPEAREFIIMRNLSAGIHRIDVEHYDADGQGTLKLGWGRLFRDE